MTRHGSIPVVGRSRPGSLVPPSVVARVDSTSYLLTGVVVRICEDLGRFLSPQSFSGPDYRRGDGKPPTETYQSQSGPSGNKTLRREPVVGEVPRLTPGSWVQNISLKDHECSLLVLSPPDPRFLGPGARDLYAGTP